jgi:hypothetical protein
MTSCPVGGTATDEPDPSVGIDERGDTVGQELLAGAVVSIQGSRFRQNATDITDVTVSKRGLISHRSPRSYPAYRLCTVRSTQGFQPSTPLPTWYFYLMFCINKLAFRLKADGG